MARKTKALAYLPFTITQSGNDAFAQTTISTALFGQTRTCYRMASLEIELPSLAIGSTSDWQFSLTRKSFAAYPTSMVLEKSAIIYHRRQNYVATAVGVMQADRTVRWSWNDDDAPVIVEDPIYAQLDSASTVLSNILYGRIGYWLDSISEVDRLQLVANSLS